MDLAWKCPGVPRRFNGWSSGEVGSELSAGYYCSIISVARVYDFDHENILLTFKNQWPTVWYILQLLFMYLAGSRLENGLQSLTEDGSLLTYNGTVTHGSTLSDSMYGSLSNTVNSVPQLWEQNVLFCSHLSETSSFALTHLSATAVSARCHKERLLWYVGSKNRVFHYSVNSMWPIMNLNQLVPIQRFV